jgi:hypothetical protein
MRLHALYLSFSNALQTWKPTRPDENVTTSCRDECIPDNIHSVEVNKDLELQKQEGQPSYAV